MKQAFFFFIFFCASFSFTNSQGYKKAQVFKNIFSQASSNQNIDWNLTKALGTLWQNTTQTYWSFELDYTVAKDNIYELTLSNTETPGTFYLFFNNQQQTTQDIYISTNCGTTSVCAAANYTATPSVTQSCWNAAIGQATPMWHMFVNPIIGQQQCSFYFTIPSVTVKPPVQFAYFPSLYLYATKNYTNIAIPWTTQANQYFSYQTESDMDTQLHGYYTVIISQLNPDVVKALYFTTNDARYSQQQCNGTFPLSTLDCGATQTNYTAGTINYTEYSFKLNSLKSLIFIALSTAQNQTENSFNFYSNTSFSCDTGYAYSQTLQACIVSCTDSQYYNSTQQQCVACNSTNLNCLNCQNSTICTKCSSNLLVIVNGTCTCEQGYYMNSTSTSNETICIACLSHCLQCTNASSCLQCDSDYYLSQGQTECISKPTATWNLTAAQLIWQNSTEIYWQQSLNYTQNSVNIYELQLAQTLTTSFTPGTFYLFSTNETALLPNIYISTNCTSISPCSAQNYSTAPSSSSNCWNAYNSSIWWMNNAASSGQCSYYFTITDCGTNCSIDFAFLPQLSLYAGINATIPLYWMFPAPMYFNFKIPASYPQINGTNGNFIGILPEVSQNVVTNMFVGSNDPKFQVNQTCNSTFPNATTSCSLTQQNYTINQNVQNYVQFSFSNPQATIILSFVAKFIPFMNTIAFQSDLLFICSNGYMPVNNTCSLLQYTNITNSSTLTLANNQQYWNQSLVLQTQGQEIIYNLLLSQQNMPGTFYLISNNVLPDTYISTNCNTTLSYQTAINLQMPQASDYSFTQKPGAASFYMNTLQYNNSQLMFACNYYFAFPEVPPNSNIQMIYRPIQTMTDSNQQQQIILLNSTTQSLPIYILYQLPLNYSQINQSFVNSYTVMISNVDQDLIENVFIYANQDQNSAAYEFPAFNYGAQPQSGKETKTGNFWIYSFLVTSLTSYNYIGFYQQQNTAGTLQLEISSIVNCNEGYQYSSADNNCVQTQDCPVGQYYVATQCVNCSASLPGCSACVSSDVCTQCGTNYSLQFGICTFACSYGFYHSRVGGVDQCLACMTNCLYCSNATICIVCEAQFFWDTKQQTCNNVSSVSITQLQATAGVYDFTLNATGQQQLFSIDIPRSSFPGAFYWVKGDMYPTVTVTTDCTNTTCQYDGHPTTSYYCFNTPYDNTTAWSLPTSQNIPQNTCHLEFYLQANTTTNQTFNFQFNSLQLLQNGPNAVSYPWEPMLPRYFGYFFPQEYQNITYATFYMKFINLDESKLNTLYFGTTDTSQNCSYLLPNQNTSCTIIKFASKGTISYAFPASSAYAGILIGLSSGLNSAMDLVVASSFQCNTGYTQLGNSCVPKVTCAQGTYYDPNLQECFQCFNTLDFCSACSSNTTCTQCSMAYLTLSQGKCIATCPSGSYPIVADTIIYCFPCQSNCLQCTNSTVCLECYTPTFQWDTKTQQCVSICQVGKYYSSSLSQCTSCDVANCNVCYSSGQQCTQCATGYQLETTSSQQDQCQKIKTKPKDSRKIGIAAITIVLLLILL